MFKRVISVLFGILLPKKPKQIYAISYSGRYCSDNPRAIVSYLKENKPEYNVIWGCHPGYEDNFPSNVKTVKIGSLKNLFVMAQSKYWISNARLPLDIYKSKRTKYVQTWHGTPLKKLAKDMDVINIVNMDPDTYVSDFLKETRRWDILISPNEYSTPIFKRCFDFKNELIEGGYPRNDVLFTGNTEDTINRIKSKIGLPQHKKVVLYAPTWRDTKSFRLPFSLYTLNEKLGNDYIILVRFHYLVRDRVDTTHYSDFCIDVSDYPEISDLYLISDVLVTDYSSTMYDYSLLKRPIVLFMDDLELYKNDLRGFYYDIEQRPIGQIVKNQKNLGQAILASEGLLENYLPNYKEFSSKYDGVSSEIVVNEVFK